MYLMFFSSGILLGPSSDGSVSYESARSFLTDLGEQGIEWYCGRSQSFIDLQGNVYQSKELEELKKILGNEIQLRNEFC